MTPALNWGNAAEINSIGPWAGAHAAHDTESLVAVQQADAPSQHPIAGRTITVNACQASSKTARHFSTFMRWWITIGNVARFQSGETAKSDCSILDKCDTGHAAYRLEQPCWTSANPVAARLI